MNMEDYFGLEKLPFPKAATAGSLYKNHAHSVALNKLLLALRRGCPALVTARSGCGKSTLMNLFSQSLDAANYQVVVTSLTTSQPFSFIGGLCMSMGLRGQRFKGETMAALLMHLRAHTKHTVFIIDEAHALPDDSLEDLRLMTTDNLDRPSPFSLILAGQPLLRERLKEPQHYALWQRLAVRIQLSPLAEQEVKPFIDTHIKAAGAQNNNIFDAKCFPLIFHHSQGLHRLVQNIAFESMLSAMTMKKEKIDTDAVDQAVIDMELV